jgi:uncharacterized membrane protein
MPTHPTHDQRQAQAAPPDPDSRVHERRTRLPGNRAYGAIKAQRAADRTTIEVVAERMIDIAGSTLFLIIHVVWFLVWVLWNTGMIGTRAFDPFPFGLLTMVVSLEAIFLSILLLIGQKREAGIAELREEITLQVSIRMEAEVTKTLQLVAGLYTRLGHRIGEDEELRDMLRPLNLSTIEESIVEEIKTVGLRAPPLR